MALNDQGLVLTTLPIAPNGNLNAGIDVPVAFGIDFDLGTVPDPFLPAGNTGQLQSRGMTTDARGNFLIALDYGGSSPGATQSGTSGYIAASVDLARWVTPR